MGNPGPEYEDTRHNAGFMFLDHLAARWRLSPFKRAGNARETSGTIDGRRVRLIKPQTFMNRSGAALASLAGASDFDLAQHLLVAVDDVATDVGRFRLRGAGSAGGQNGLRSIEAALRRQDYARLRIGVGPVPADVNDLADYVLDAFTRGERTAVQEQFETMAEAVECWAADGIERAMTRFNRK
ncbi:MAG: aminoacyl-tRNA hydrolase [Gemmatimonadales bacterium]|nr:aminoacyl-tRNA hydrolase [Gemmatimonadales bacterium]